MLSKHMTILDMDLGDGEEGTVAFNNIDPEDTPEADLNPDPVVVILTEDMWAQLGSPTQVTVSVEPGDHLNRETDRCLVRAQSGGARSQCVLAPGHLGKHQADTSED